jgi:ABC-type nitrate/sulfonate/bicarbonate transport system substrate-binding protein
MLLSRRLSLSALFVVGLLLLAACGGAEPDAPDAELSQDLIRISVGIDAAYAPMFVADELGYFEEEGVNVEVVQFAQGGEGIDAMIAGEIQLGGSGDATIIGKSIHGDIRALVIFQESGDYLKLVVREEINDASEIQTFGVVPGSLSEYGATRLLAYQGRSEDEVEFVPAGPPELPPLLQRGDVDAFVIWEPWPSQAEELGGKVLMRTKEFEYSYVQFVMANGDWLADHENEARAVVRAIARGSEYTEANPQETAEIVERVVNLPEEQTLQAVDQIDFGVREVNDQDMENFENIAAFLMSRGVVDTAPDIDRIMERGYAP